MSEQQKVILNNQLDALAAVGAMEKYIGKDSLSVDVVKDCTPREASTIIFGILPSLTVTRKTDEVDIKADEVLLGKAARLLKVMSEERKLKEEPHGGEGIPSGS